MTQEIKQAGTNLGFNLTPVATRVAFDIIDYEVTTNSGDFVGAYRHYTGRTANGVIYPTESILVELEKDLKILKNERAS